MDELGFRNWLLQKGMPQKQIQDACSRLKCIENTIQPDFDIDEEYQKNQCSDLLHWFDNKGVYFSKHFSTVTLPIGKYYLSSYKLSLNKYISYLNQLVD